MKKIRKFLVSLTLALALSLNLGMYPGADISEAVGQNGFLESDLTRFDGKNRYAVAADVLENFYKNPDKVILASGLDFPDSVSGSMLSLGKYPILYTGSDSLDTSTKDALKKADPSEVVIVGGEKAISKKVESSIKNDLGIKVTRIAGSNRYDTNVNIAKTAYPSSKRGENLIIASGEDFADAISSTSLSEKYKAPIILVGGDKLSANSEAYIKELGKNFSNVFIVGGPVAVSNKLEDNLNSLTGKKAQRIAGDNRYETSLRVAEKTYANPSSAIIATGEVYVDALTAAPLSQKIKAPILLSKQYSISDDIVDYIFNPSTQKLYIIGGPKAISPKVESIFAASSNSKPSDMQESNENLAKERLAYYQKKYPDKKVEVAPIVDGAEEYPEYVIDLGNNRIRVVRGYFDDELSSRIFDKLNAYRKKNGLDGLKWDGTMDSVAKTRGVETSYLFDHQRPRGSYATDIENINGENIYKGSDEPEGIMEAWKESEDHNLNMLRDVFTRVNVKVFVTRVPYENSKETYEQYYAVQLFGV
ncbi:MAG: cell wall-binding repeat-containing protein [Finegoldia sp.]|nr:cell wall-binding repeat-containing protein [Finegoldia sp.]